MALTPHEVLNEPSKPLNGRSIDADDGVGLNPAMAIFEFGPFLLDPAKRSLVRDGVPQSVTPKAFDVLLLLVEQRGRVLSKDELLKTIWPDTFVDEANLSQQIFMLRRILNGDSKDPEYIATVPRRGYSFVGDAIERPVTEPAVARPVRRWRRVPALWLAALTVVVMLVGVRSWWRPAGSGPRILSVTALPGLEQHPSISPDGNFVAFSWTGPDVEGRPHIWIKAVDSEAKRRLTETPQAESRPAWSPDGREIAFLRAGQGVFVASALGGSERQISKSGSMVGWTPDGRSLLITDRLNDGPRGIFKIDLGTGERRQVTQPSAGMGDWTFAVSPDGSTLAFVRYGRPGISDLYVVPIEGGEGRRRTNWDAQIGGVAWTPDGRDLLYSVHEATGLDQYLFRIAAEGRAPEHGARALHTAAVGPSMSRPAPGVPGRIAFTTGRIDVGLRLIDLGNPGSGEAIGNAQPFADSTRIDCPGRFSRNGTRVAFLSSRTGWVEAWVADDDGSHLRQATTLRATEMLIGGWSPDQRRFAIDAAIAGNSDVYLVSLDGTPPVHLTTEPGFDGLADWSADGRWIYFSSDRSGRNEIWKVPSAGGPAVQVTRHGGVQAREAPDGRTLYYLDRTPPGAGGVSGTSRLMQVPTDGGDEAVVLEGVRFGLWSVTDQGIVFVTIAPAFDALDLYAFADRRVHRIGVLPHRVSRIAGLAGLDVSRDGRSALINVTDHWESDIMVADGIR